MIYTCPGTPIHPAFNYGGSANYTVDGIYTDAAATMSAGTYNSTTNTFMPTNPLVLNTPYVFWVKLKDLAMNCEVIVEWNMSITEGPITFTGMGDGTDWHDPLNWDLNVVPNYCHDVIIPGPDNPIINAGLDGYARSVTIHTTLTIQTTGTLTINGSLADAIDVKTNGSLDNSGTITIGDTGIIGGNGIHSDGMITNATNALIQIDNTGSDGIGNLSTSASITNNGDIVIGSSGSGSIGSHGLRNYSPLINNTGGLIQIDNTASGSDGIFNSGTSASITNDGDIVIGSSGIGSIGAQGLDNDAIVINSSGGLIQVDNTVSRGISNSNIATTASITNDGEIIIGSQGVVGSIGAEGIYNINALTNNTNGLIQIDNTASHGFFLFSASASVTNDGDIKIGSSGAGSIGNRGLSIGGIGISNNVNGLIQVDNTSSSGIRISSVLTNDGEVNIGTNGYIGAIGIESLTNSSFVNNGNMTVGGPSGSLASDGIRCYTLTSFQNNTCASIFLYGKLNNASAGLPIINDGYIYVKTTLIHVPGLFVNNGVIDDPQNGIDTGANGFTNNNIVITSTYFNCPEELSPAFDYGGAANYTVEGIYSDAAATMSAG